jgi:tetratricopeptide (TPR) repeat protein
MTRRLAPPLCCAVSPRRTLRLASLLAVLLATCTAALAGAAKPPPADAKAAAPAPAPSRKEKVREACAALRSRSEALRKEGRLPARPAKARAPEVSEKGIGIKFVSLGSSTGASAAQLLELARDYSWTGEVTKELACLEQIGSEFPDAPKAGQALVNRASRYDALGDTEQAQALYDQAAAQYPDAATQEYLLIAQTWDHRLQDGTGEAAVAVLALMMYTPAEPENGALAALRLADLLKYDLHDYEGGRDVYQTVAEAYPGTPYAREAKLGEAECLAWGLGLQTDARDLFKEVAGEASEYRYQLRAVFGVAHSFFETGPLDPALAIYGQIRENYPGTRQADQAQVETAIAYDALGRADEALAEVKDYLSHPVASPHDDPVYLAWAHYTFGSLLLRQGDRDEAEVEFQRALVDPRAGFVLTPAYQGLAQCLDARGDAKGAIAAYAAAADSATRPDQKPLMLWSAFLLALREGDRAQASALETRLESECPDSYLVERARARLAPASGSQ